MSYYSNGHPEKKDGEVLVGNFPKNQADHISWKTKRIGKIAYDSDDNLIKGTPKHLPVFCQRSEMEKAGIDTTGIV